jgi:predicted ArsR family transcriptional regulator
VATLTKTAVRKTVSRGKFTRVEFEQALGVTAPTARRQLRALTEAGVIEALDETQKVTNDDGEPQRGRPRQVYKVASGK